MGLICVVAYAHGIGKHVRYVTLLLDTLEQVAEGAGGEYGHVASIVESLLLVDGSVLNIIWRVG